MALVGALPDREALRRLREEAGLETIGFVESKRKERLLADHGGPALLVGVLGQGAGTTKDGAGVVNRGPGRWVGR